MLKKNEVENLKNLCKENRQNILKMVHNASSGHIGGAFSAVEILTVLFHKSMKNATQWHRDTDFEKRDRFVLSKGHASAAYYSIISQLGYIEKEELSENLEAACKAIQCLYVRALKLQQAH